MAGRNIMIGFKNEFFEVIESAGRNPKTRSLLWKCICRCGKTTILQTNQIKKERVKSCGCSRKGKNKGNKFGFKHGLTRFNGRSHPLYEMRNRILTRCYSAKKSDYPYYQGKGIRVYEEWIHNPKSFFEWAYANNWQKGMVIDRIDTNKDYEPTNCQFLTISENIKKRHKEGKYPRIKREIVKSCFRCKCTADENGPCKKPKESNG
jgi:hypothetical protein